LYKKGSGDPGRIFAGVLIPDRRGYNESDKPRENGISCYSLKI
jgi:hypothetical protein